MDRHNYLISSNISCSLLIAYSNVVLVKFNIAISVFTFLTPFSFVASNERASPHFKYFSELSLYLIVISFGSFYLYILIPPS